MREKRSAPVDTLGASKCYDETADEKVFQNIFALKASLNKSFADSTISNSCFFDAFKSNKR